MNIVWLPVAIGVFTALCIAMFFIYYIMACLPKPHTIEWITARMEKKTFSFNIKRYKLEKKDIIPMIALTLFFGVLGFFYLGDTTAPQSFFQFNDEHNTVTIELEQEKKVSRIMYYTGLWIGNYDLEFSADGTNWIKQNPAEGEDYAMDQTHADLFKWRYAGVNGNVPVKYIRITPDKMPLELGELAIYDENGLLPAKTIKCPTAPELFDEQEIIPDSPECLNGMYFDEIYHGRTAYEYLRGIPAYENTHPPLGKLIISIGVSIFGMTPFGWRFMGTLFGVFMLTILYIFLKNMFGKTPIAICGTLLFGFDFMHYTQTRIATIDTYAVFFIMLAYYFMYRYITQPPETRFSKTLLPLAMSGLFFGIGCASKWVVAYAGAGLAIIYFVHLVLNIMYFRNEELPGLGKYVIKTLLFSVLFYVIVPVVIYCASYIPNGIIQGMSIREGMLWSPEFYKSIWDNQVHMFTYHSGLEATHSYQSVWWQWITDARPILYYRSYPADGMKSAISAFGNPVVWWGGFLAIIAMAVQMIKNRDSRAMFILIGYLAQLLPWVFISRCAFIYHYFPCVLFMVIALAHVLNKIWERQRSKYKLIVFGFTASAGLLFILFYPSISGMPAPEAYTSNVLRWVYGMWPL